MRLQLAALVVGIVLLGGTGHQMPSHHGMLALGTQERYLVRVPEDYRTIQAAIDAVAPGGMILIGPGTYQENLRIIKSVHIVGAGPELVRLYSPDERPTIYMEATFPIQVSLKGITIGDPTRSVEPSCDPETFSYPLVPCVGVQVRGLVQVSLHNLIIGGWSTAAVLTEEWRPHFQEPSWEPHLILAEVRLVNNGFGIATLGGNVVILNSVIQGNRIGVLHMQEIKGELILYRSSIVENSTGAITILYLDSFLAGGKMGHIAENEIARNGGGIYIGARIPGSWINISFNRIAYNAGYGVVIFHPKCPEIGLEMKALFYLREQSAPIEIAGRENELLGNAKGDLCPPDYPWPPGFRK